MSAESVRLTEDDLALARRLAEERLHQRARHLSPTRESSGNLVAQLRGACGEIGVSRWLTTRGWPVTECFLDDDVRLPDIIVAGVGIEVMTAQTLHRERTGYCVPPNKLWAARQRRASAYVFAGTGPEAEPREIIMQGWCRVAEVDHRPTRLTRVGSSPPVENYVVTEYFFRDARTIDGLLDV